MYARCFKLCCLLQEYENEAAFKKNNSHNGNPHLQKDAILSNGRTNKKTAENSEEILVGQRIEVFFSEVTVVGLKYVVLTGGMYVRKAIWLLFVLGGFSFMIYQFYDRYAHLDFIYLNFWASTNNHYIGNSAVATKNSLEHILVSLATVFTIMNDGSAIVGRK